MTPKQVKALRKKLGLSLRELGLLLGVTGNTVARWEGGFRQAKGPVVALMRRIAAERAQAAASGKP